MFQIVFLRGGLVNQEQQRNFMFSFYPAYIAYKDETSPLWPMPRAMWRSVPAGLKKTLFLELTKFTEYDRELVSEMDALKKGHRKPLSPLAEEPTILVTEA
jgi:hypothetical protein